MNKNLVISSDDFGMTASVNEGIRLAYKKRMLSSTNLMVPCPWFEQAVNLSKDMNIDIGIHLTLTSEWRFYRWRPLTGNCSLRDESGYLYTSIETLMAKASKGDIKAECRAQIELVLARGVKPAYLDLHMCIPTVSGVHPNKSYELELMNIVKEISDEFSLPYAYETLDGGRLKYFDSGLSISSKEREKIQLYISQLPEGTHHLSCHCAVDSYEQSNLAHPSDGNYQWASEIRRVDMRLILSDWFADLLRSNNICVVYNYFSSKIQTSEKLSA